MNRVYVYVVHTISLRYLYSEIIATCCWLKTASVAGAHAEDCVTKEPKYFFSSLSPFFIVSFQNMRVAEAFRLRTRDYDRDRYDRGYDKRYDDRRY